MTRLETRDGQPTLSTFYAELIHGRRVLLADDVRNTGLTLRHCADLVRASGGEVVGAVVIVDRMDAATELGAPTVALVDYPAPANHSAAECPLWQAGVPITSF